MIVVLAAALAPLPLSLRLFHRPPVHYCGQLLCRPTWLGSAVDCSTSVSLLSILLATEGTLGSTKKRFQSGLPLCIHEAKKKVTTTSRTYLDNIRPSPSLLHIAQHRSAILTTRESDHLAAEQAQGQVINTRRKRNIRTSTYQLRHTRAVWSCPVAKITITP